MTREKAIERLNRIKIHGADIPSESIDMQRRDIEALDMAIEALEQEPRWISSDNPPKRAMRVFVDYEITRYMGVKRSIRDVGIGCYCNGWYIENHNGEKVEMKIHKWMPLPESEDNK